MKIEKRQNITIKEEMVDTLGADIKPEIKIEIHDDLDSIFDKNTDSNHTEIEAVEGDFASVYNQNFIKMLKHEYPNEMVGNITEEDQKDYADDLDKSILTIR